MSPLNFVVPRPLGQTTDRWGGIVLLGNSILNSFDNEAGGGANPDGSVFMLLVLNGDLGLSCYFSTTDKDKDMG